MSVLCIAIRNFIHSPVVLSLRLSTGDYSFRTWLWIIIAREKEGNNTQSEMKKQQPIGMQ